MHRNVYFPLAVITVLVTYLLLYNIVEEVEDSLLAGSLILEDLLGTMAEFDS